MVLRALALALLTASAGLTQAEAASCPVKKFPVGARVRSADLDTLFGKVDKPEKPLRFVYVTQSTEDAFWRQIIAGIEAEGARLGIAVKAVAPADRLSEPQQIEVAKQVLADPPDVLLVTPITAGNLKPVLDEANAKGIPTVAINMATEGARSFIGTDHVRLGAMAAEFLHELYPAGASVAEIEGPVDSPYRIDRVKGFAEGLAFYPSLTLVGSRAADWSREKARDATLALVAEHPEIQGLYANNDTMALGAVDALKSLGRLNDVAIVGTDAIPEARAALKTRAMKGTAAQFPVKEGELAVQTGLRLLACQAIPPWIVSPQAMMTQKSLEDYAEPTQ
ncbi:hypothetical protein GCM10011390_29510 [Aureimonas endophytica]|uniref:Periplasmic binding protein domain-containing protein n=1 Tax=Aureimonas endophytica TaxID=2027858 RepID=A0A916ZPY7_9HYPH|nr:substrate-binding domain-containing protein [Aureimonas endophytica]GGE08523.1 hypothetical protein GCM10011390_29510 [Aureimonas endophytica]